MVFTICLGQGLGCCNVLVTSQSRPERSRAHPCSFEFFSVFNRHCDFMFFFICTVLRTNVNKLSKRTLCLLTMLGAVFRSYDSALFAEKTTTLNDK